MSPEDILRLIKEKNVKFVDLRFTDTRGKEQHVTVPSHVIDDRFFEDGKMFDGSSISGWKAIDESDMTLMPDPPTAVLDVFSEEPTLNVRCDVLEPTTMQGYTRCPRSAAKRAEAYMRSTGIADEAYFGPENEFFIFDDVRWGVEMRGAFYNIESVEAHWHSAREYEEGNIGHRPASKAATSLCRRWIHSTISARRFVWRLRRWASPPRCITTRWPPRVRARSASSSTRWSGKPTPYRY